MYKITSIKEFQKDVDVGWLEFCDLKIVHFRKLSLNSKMEHSKNFLERQINHWKVMRKIR